MLLLLLLQVFRFEQAEGDAQRVLGFKDLPEPDRVKALLRRGTARMGLHKFEESSRDFNLVLALQPNNRQAKEDLRVRQRNRRCRCTRCFLHSMMFGKNICMQLVIDSCSHVY